MANIVRCKLPDGVHRFKPFTVSDYRDFLLVRNNMNRSEAEQKELLDELLEDYFSEFPVSWRPFIFIKVFTTSIGKAKIPLVFECSKCGKNKQFLFNMDLDSLKNPVLEVAGLKIQFNYPSEEYKDPTELILNTIATVQDEAATYKWEDLSDEEQTSVIEAIDIKSLEKIIKEMKPFHIEANFGCCVRRRVVYDNFVDIFKLILNPDEVFTFYQVNHLLVKSNYSLDGIMSMIPIERSIALSLVEKDTK